VNKLRPQHQTPKRPTATLKLVSNENGDDKRPTFHELISHRQLRSINQLPNVNPPILKSYLPKQDAVKRKTISQTISIFKSKGKPQIDVKMDSSLRKN
jgi:hypothetical protein